MIQNIFYTLIIFPIKTIIEICFMVFERLFNTGTALIGVSAVVSLGTLPLYMVAEKWQQTEREIQKKLKPGIDNIKKSFKGDKQYMILSTFYRQNHYHPVYALRSTFSLLIQVPFFIAAYSYLSRLTELKGAHFLFINDLASPDALVHFGLGFTVNLLPILMTTINCLAGAIYTRGFPLKEKIQLYGMAAIFLLLLYNSPSGLVLYWTMNNIFSLFKNILQKVKYSRYIVLGLLFAVAAAIDIYILVFFKSGYFAKRLLVVICVSLVFPVPFIPMAVKKLRKIGIKAASNCAAGENSSFILSTIILFLLTGLAIPLTLVSSSVQEFSFINPHKSPFPFIIQTALQGAGFFLFWALCIYALFPRKVKLYLSIAAGVFFTLALINTYIFRGNYGFLTTSLSFSNPGFKTVSIMLLFQIFFLAAAFIFFLYLLLSRHKIIFITFQTIIIISLTVFSLYNTFKIASDFHKFLNAASQNQAGKNAPVYTFSQKGKNVLIVMLDRAISGYLPYIFEEKPELKEVFNGFTWYPNCTSFGGVTLFGAPPVFGGYEYTPLYMTANNSQSLLERHNESLLMLPKLFSDNGYKTTFTDPTWANYSWTPDLRIFDDYPSIHAENIIGKYTGDWIKKHSETPIFDTGAFLKDNLIRFSLFKIAPPFLRFFIYDDSKWLSNIGKSNELSTATMNEYIALDMLPEITKIVSTDDNYFTIMVNQLTHEPAFFEYPSYTPVQNVTNRGAGPFAQEMDYHVNIAALLLLGKWFQALKDAGCWDNTKIIITADHGWNLFTKFPDNILLPNGKCVEAYNPLFLFKDFDARGAIKTDLAFMTNADTPILAVKNLFLNPVNPFTGKPLIGEKDKGATITTSSLWSPDHHRKYTLKTDDGDWLHVHDSIFDPANWEKTIPDRLPY